MGLLSTLAKIGGVVAAPFSGGASLALTGIGQAADVLGKQQQGAAQGRAMEANAQQNQDRNALDLYRTQQDAQFTAGNQDLQRKSYESQTKRTAMRDALLSMLMSNYRPTSVSVSGVRAANVGGGIAETLRSPGVLAALQRINTNAGSTADTPMSFQGGEILKAPTMTPLPSQSGGSKLLDVLARIGQIGGAVGGVMGSK